MLSFFYCSLHTAHKSTFWLFMHLMIALNAHKHLHNAIPNRPYCIVCPWISHSHSRTHPHTTHCSQTNLVLRLVPLKRATPGFVQVWPKCTLSKDNYKMIRASAGFLFPLLLFFSCQNKSSVSNRALGWFVVFVGRIVILVVLIAFYQEWNKWWLWLHH